MPRMPSRPPALIRAPNASMNALAALPVPRPTTWPSLMDSRARSAISLGMSWDTAAPRVGDDSISEPRFQIPDSRSQIPDPRSSRIPDGGEAADSSATLSPIWNPASWHLESSSTGSGRRDDHAAVEFLGQLDLL